MAGQPQNVHARAVITEHLLANPDTPKKTAADYLYAKYPELWPSAESCRSMVRHVTGANGTRHKPVPELLRPHGKQTDRPWTPLPEGMRDFDDWGPYNLASGTWLAMGDQHAPYHDVEAIECALETGLKMNCTGVLMGGDHLDCYAVSRWETDPRIRNLPRELEVCNAMLDSVASAFEGKDKAIITGNHDERLEKYLMKKAPELLGVREFELSHLLRYEERGFDVVPERRVVRAGKLNVIHGHEFGRTFSSPVNPARGLYNRGKAHALCFHYHRTSQHSETDMEGKTTTTYSVGMCCDPHPKFLPMNKWNPGFAVIHCQDDGAFEVENFRVVNGRPYR